MTKSILDKIEKRSSLDFSKECMRDYGTYSLMDRALPFNIDGLKPVHRRVLWAAFNLKLHSNKPTIKCARIVGDTIGKYHPHGDSGAYQALVTLVSSVQIPILYGQGNFGNKVTGDSAAAYRYTESKLTKFTEDYLLDQDYLACIPMVPNYDGKNTEPTYLPAKLPLSLIHGIEGIATGASTIIPSFSLSSVTRLVKRALTKGKVTPKAAFNILEFNFREGGFVENKSDYLVPFFKRGTGSIIIYPYMHYDDKLKAIVMTSYVPRFKIEHLQKALTIEGISDIEDLTSKKLGIRILFKLKKSLTSKEGRKILGILQNKFATNLPASIMVISKNDKDENMFKYTNPSTIVNDWVDWRIKFEKVVVGRLIELESDKVQRLNWLLWAMENKELVFKGLETNNPEQFLVKKGKITEQHSKYIYDLLLRRLAKLEKEKLLLEIKERTKTIKQLRADIKTTKATSLRVLKDLRKLNLDN